MNALSLAYSNAKNQQPSWIDDPFDLKEPVTGVTQVARERSLKDYALELVGSFADFIGNQYELTLEKLSSVYQFELVRHYIESIDREIEWACYGEDLTLNSSFLCAMLEMLKNCNSETSINFAQVTTRNLVAYYKDTLQKILDIACNDYYLYQLNESDLG
jgi:hypothetical protein